MGEHSSSLIRGRLSLSAHTTQCSRPSLLFFSLIRLAANVGLHVPYEKKKTTDASFFSVTKFLGLIRQLICNKLGPLTTLDHLINYEFLGRLPDKDVTLKRQQGRPPPLRSFSSFFFYES